VDSSFKQKVTQQLKVDEDMAIDSALWYLQGTANFTYGKASQETAETVIDSTFITLAIANNKIALNEVWNKYTDMIDSIRDSYQKITSAEKQLISVQVEMRQLSESEVVFKEISTFGKGGFPPDYCTFNETDSWIWWNYTGDGICAGPNFGQHPELDAAILINQKIMNCKGVPIGNYYWSDQESVELWPWDYPNPNWGGNWNYERYLLYWNYQAYPSFHGCITPDECNFYLSGTKIVINTSQSNGGARPDNKGLISVAIEGDEIGDNQPPYYSTYLHHGFAFYGVLHWNPYPPSPLD